MNDSHNLHRLRADILRFFLEDGARQTYEFVDYYGTETYDERFLRRLIYAMAHAGLLDKLGSTRGSFFMGNRLGYVVLATLVHEYLSGKDT